MALKYTKHLLKKIEELFKELEYTILYAKGNFQSGYCIVAAQRMVVINKFYETEGRINVLIDILDKLDLDVNGLSKKSKDTFKQVITSLQEE